jgi:hypothetical protein
MEAIGASERRGGMVSPSSSNGLHGGPARSLPSAAETGVDNVRVRPELRDERFGMTADVDEVDAARAREYALLSLLLTRAPDRSLLQRLAGLRGDASPIGAAHAALAEAAGRTSAERVEREYFDLFVGLGRGTPPTRFVSPGFCMNGRWRLRASGSLDRAGGWPERAGRPRRDPVRGHGHVANGELPAPAGADRELAEQHVSP